MTPYPLPRESAVRDLSHCQFAAGLPCGSEASGNKKARSGFHRACFGRDQNNSLKRSLQVERGEQYTTEWGFGDCGLGNDECRRINDE